MTVRREGCVNYMFELGDERSADPPDPPYGLTGRRAPVAPDRVSNLRDPLPVFMVSRSTPRRHRNHEGI